MSIYGSRGSTLGSGYGIGSKRPRVMESNPYFAVTAGAYVSNISHGAAGAVAFPVVKVRGLPFNCSDVDVYRFFSGLDIVDLLLTHRAGRFSGEAFVVFAAPVHAELALQRDRHVIGHRYVEVFRSTKVDYYYAIAAELGGGAASPPPRGKEQKAVEVNTAVLKLRGLPFSATCAAIVDFFCGFEVSEDSIHVALRKDGKPTGEAYVEFSSAAEAKRAMVAKDKMSVGSRYVEIFPSSPEEARRAQSRSRV